MKTQIADHVTIDMLYHDIVETTTEIKQNSKLMAKVNGSSRRQLLLHKVSNEFTDRNYEKAHAYLGELIESMFQLENRYGNSKKN